MYIVNFFNIFIFIQLFWLIDIVSIDKDVSVVFKSIKNTGFFDYGCFISFYIVSVLFWYTFFIGHVDGVFLNNGFTALVRKLNLIFFLFFYISWFVLLFFLHKINFKKSSYWLCLYSIVIIYCVVNYFSDWFLIFISIEFLTFLLIGYFSNFKFKDSNFLYSYLWISILSSILFLVTIYFSVVYYSSHFFLISLIFVSWKLGILPFGFWLTYFYSGLPDMALYTYLCFFYTQLWFLVICLFFFITFDVTLNISSYFFVSILMLLSNIILFLSRSNTDNINSLWVYTTWSAGFLFYCVSFI